MRVSPQNTLLRAILDLFAAGLPQDAAVTHFIHSTYGALSPAALDAQLADREDPQTASLVELLLFPGEAVALTLEPALAEARLDADGCRILTAMLAEAGRQAVVVMPDGRRFAVPLTPEDAQHFVTRLAPTKNLPVDIAQMLRERFDPHDALALAVVARHAGPEWTPSAASFCRTLLGHLTADTPNAQDLIRFILRFLNGLPKNALPLPALIKRRGQLAAQLRRAQQQEETLAKSNFETRIMAGARLPYLHAPDIERELALAETAILTITGRLPDAMTTSCQYMGTVTDMDGMFAALDDQTDTEEE